VDDLEDPPGAQAFVDGRVHEADAQRRMGGGGAHTSPR